MMNRNSSNLLINENPLIVLPSLAVRVGLNEALILQQVHYWIGNPKAGIVMDGRKWVWNTIAEWSEQFPFWGERTIRRAIKSATDQGFLLIGHYSKNKADRTNYYSINYEKLNNQDAKSLINNIRSSCPDHEDKMASPTGQNGLTIRPNCPHVYTETSSRDYTETTAEIWGAPAENQQQEPQQQAQAQPEKQPATQTAPVLDGEVISFAKHRGTEGGKHASNPVWKAYAQAYAARYGKEPLATKRAVSAVGRLVGLVNGDEQLAADIAGFYPTHNGEYYLKRGHDIAVMLADVEKLYMEMETGRTITATSARQTDRSAGNLGALQEALRRIDSGAA
ncbi:MAG: hypothetical protein PHE17_19575 [Thiothrix sp.]|uniref:hypothetical protein n=1 Tax=Thiothrix sp. TaxID=1032 RepID=UPI002636F59A|nr:hypothetical protein [Thiothrix sp.]MDD5395229.1 hypothetical protein [Thiothrix sp.]